MEGKWEDQLLYNKYTNVIKEWSRMIFVIRDHLFWCARHEQSFYGESPLQTWQWKLLDEDKGVHCEVVSE